MTESQFTNIINYIYSAKNVNKEISDINTFFNDSKIFPEFISIIYKQNLFDFTNSKSVFDQTLDFLIKRDSFFEKFRDMKPENCSENDKTELLMSLFTRLFFKMDEQEILEKSREIFESCENEYKIDEKNIFSGKFIYLLLVIVTEGEIQDKDDDEEPDYNKNIDNFLKKAKVPNVILQPINCNKGLFLIQIQIIFQIYSKIISEITKKFDLFSSINLRRGANNKDPVYLLNKSASLTTNCYMKIINYILISKSSEKQFTSLSDLYKNGIKEFIDIVKEITGINVIYQENVNSNELFTEIADKLNIQKKFDFNDENDLYQFIELIFTKNNYFKNSNNILKYCNKILVDYGFKIESIEDIFNSKGFEYFMLIHRLILIQFKVLKYDLIPPRYKVSFDLLKNAFERFNISFILDEKIFGYKKFQSFCEFPLKFQLKIILDKFEQKYLDKLLKYKREFEFEKKEEKKEKYLILTLNAVGLRNGLFIYNIKSFLKGNLFQFFVEGLIEKNLSDYIDIKQLETNEKSEDNILKIIEYLKTQKKIFNTLAIDFKNEEFTIKSIESVILTLLDLYFIKQPKKILFEKCNSIIGLKTEVYDVKDFSSVCVFFYLLNFLSHGNLKCKYDFDNYENKDLNESFKDANVEQIIDQRCILQPYAYRKYIYYQLQIYFNKLNEILCSQSPLKIIERLFAVASMLNRLKSSITIFLSNILIKKVIYESVKDNEKENEKIDQDLYYASSRFQYSNVNATKIFDESIFELKKIDYQKKKHFIDNQSLYNFLTNYEATLNDLAYELEFIKKTQNILTTIVSCDKKKNEFIKYYNILTHICSFSSIKKNPPENKKLYKIFYYNESLSKWIFNSSEFFSLINDYELGMNYRNTCFISFMNTSIDEICTFNPNIDKKKLDDKNFIVYGYHYDYIDNKKSKEINPIYLFLSFPKFNVMKDKKDILSIVMQVYMFLYAFSDIQIVLINKCFKEQLSMTKLINDFQNEVNFKYLKTTLFIINKDFDKNQDHFEIINKDQDKMQFIAVTFLDEKHEFYDYLNELIIQYQPITFYDLFLRFDNFSKIEMHGLYFKLRFQFDKTEEFLKKMIKKRVNELTNNEFDIKYEFSWFPDFDTNFASQYQFLFYNELKEQNKINLIKDNIKKQMKERADDYIKSFSKFVKTKYYIERKEIIMYSNGFENFLDEIYENIITAFNLFFISENIYKDCLDILDDIKKEYLNTFYSEFKNFEEKIEKRNKKDDRNLLDDFKTSTRYIMKEVEHIKEIKCEVEIEGQGLKKEIEQDF